MVSKAILIIPGHNSSGNKPRFLALDAALSRKGFSVSRFSAKRQVHVTGEELTLTVSEEYEQVKRAAVHLAKDHQVIAIGHSQGAAIALRLGYEKIVQDVVSLMGDTSALEDVTFHLKMLGMSIEQVRAEQFVRYERDSGQANWYSAAWFEDYLLWKIPLYASGNFPKFFIAGTQDTFNTPGKVKTLADGAALPREYLEIDSEHTFEPEHANQIATVIAAWAATPQ